MSIRKSKGIIASHAWCCRQLGRGSESVFCKEGGEHQSICVLTRWPTISSSFFHGISFIWLGEEEHIVIIQHRDLDVVEERKGEKKLSDAEMRETKQQTTPPQKSYYIKLIASSHLSQSHSHSLYHGSAIPGNQPYIVANKWWSQDGEPFGLLAELRYYYSPVVERLDFE